MPRPRRSDGRNANTISTNKWQQKHYDQIALRVKKGQREVVKRYADEHGETVMGLLNRLLAEEIPDFDPIHSDEINKE